MISDDERREVARKLRELPTDMYEVEELWEMKGLDTCCKDQTDYYLIHFALFECFPVDHMHPCDYEELHMRLADLIEPDHVGDSNKMVDREALMALAEEMHGYADGAASGDGFPYVNAGSLWSYADRIREALGVEK